MSEIDIPQTLEEWLVRLKRYESTIYVREQVDGKWDAVPLSELSAERWGASVARWLDEGHVPIRIRSDEEVDSSHD